MIAGFSGGLVVKNLPAHAEDLGSIPGSEEPLEKEMTTTPVFLRGKSHRQRSLVGYNQRAAKESDKT